MERKMEATVQGIGFPKIKGTLWYLIGGSRNKD